MSAPPKRGNANLVLKRKAYFEAFLTARGAEVLQPTNEYELVRFKSGSNTSIIYSKKDGRLTFYGAAEEAWFAFVSNSAWRASIPIPKRNAPSLATLQVRDNNTCFYCLQLVSNEDASEEHLLSRTHGGPDTLQNKVLAHKVCNSHAGHSDLFAKIQLHTQAVLALYKRNTQ
jgi:hypothetical protein